MYRDGKPIRKHTLKPIIVITIVVVVLLCFIYLIFVKDTGSNTKLTNGDALLTKVNNKGQISVTVNEPYFTMELPGTWNESSRDSDPNYQSIQWNTTDSKSGNRWVRIYIDSIPSDFAVNYLLPVTANNNKLEPGQISDNCVTFTRGANQSNKDVSTPIGKESLPALWQKVSFRCDNTHTTHQVVGTGSTEGRNAVTVTGQKHGTHKYFIIFRDDNIRPDYTILTSIIESFQAK
jgi:hypothetical protein